MVQTRLSISETKMEKFYLSIADIATLAQSAAGLIISTAENPAKVYPIPRGGIPAALAIGKYANIVCVTTPEEADYIVDDLIDSGDTMRAALAQAPRHAKAVV